MFYVHIGAKPNIQIIGKQRALRAGAETVTELAESVHCYVRVKYKKMYKNI